jgi:N-acetylglutamate synthase-like GNAT family acetyltransferase
MLAAMTKLTIRRATAADVPRIAEMMAQLSEREHSIENVRIVTGNFKSDDFYGWVACADERLVGVTMLQPWVLQHDAGLIRGGYWRYLWIDPDHRSTMLYPRLVHTMITESAKLGIDLVYGAIRRPDVAAGHLALGMQKVVEIPVLLKPLRPARLLCKYYEFGNAFETLSALPDGVYRGYRLARRIGAPSGYVITDFAANEIDPSTVIPVLGEHDPSELQRLLTRETFAARYHINSDGVPYRVLCVKKDGVVQAAIVYRTALRRNIYSVVIMEMGCGPANKEALNIGLAELERRAIEWDCEAVLGLFSRSSIQEILRKAGYHKSTETYVLMKKWTSKQDIAPTDNINNWHFTFADHDAF